MEEKENIDRSNLLSISRINGVPSFRQQLAEKPKDKSPIMVTENTLVIPTTNFNSKEQTTSQSRLLSSRRSHATSNEVHEETINEAKTRLTSQGIRKSLQVVAKEAKKQEYWWSKQMTQQQNSFNEQQRDENPNIKTAASQRNHTKEEMEELEAALLDSPTWQHRKNSLGPEPFKQDSCDDDINVIYGAKKK